MSVSLLSASFLSSSAPKALTDLLVAMNRAAGRPRTLQTAEHGFWARTFDILEVVEQAAFMKLQ